MDVEDLSAIRQDIDKIDQELVRLLCQRMDCSRRVAETKRRQGLPILNQEREDAILDKVAAMARDWDTEGDGYDDVVRLIYGVTMDASRAVQHRRLAAGEGLRRHLAAAHRQLPASASARVVCAGCAGAYADEAAGRLFPGCRPQFVEGFVDVFREVQEGRADFGIVPVENSFTGSVHEVYDLVMKYRFTIAGATEVPIRHHLAAPRGARLAGIRTVYSHPQGLLQCSRRLTELGAETRTYSNTAAAARMVAELGDPTVAAVCSRRAAELYNLDILEDNIQNTDTNRTRFLAITPTMVIPADANRISLIFSLPHVTGSLYRVLARFAAAGLNLTKVESRPAPAEMAQQLGGGDGKFTYVFYLDFEGSLSSPGTVDMLCALSDELPLFSFLGNYHEQGPEE